MGWRIGGCALAPAPAPVAAGSWGAAAWSGLGLLKTCRGLGSPAGVRSSWSAAAGCCGSGEAAGAPFLEGLGGLGDAAGFSSAPGLRRRLDGVVACVTACDASSAADGLLDSMSELSSTWLA